MQFTEWISNRLDYSNKAISSTISDQYIWQSTRIPRVGSSNPNGCCRKSKTVNMWSRSIIQTLNHLTMNFVLKPVEYGCVYMQYIVCPMWYSRMRWTARFTHALFTNNMLCWSESLSNFMFVVNGNKMPWFTWCDIG